MRCLSKLYLVGPYLSPYLLRSPGQGVASQVPSPPVYPVYPVYPAYPLSSSLVPLSSH